MHSYQVLMIAPTSFFADYGCHVRILEEARSLQNLGHQITIATYHSGTDIADLDIRRTLPIPWRRGYEVGSSKHKIAFDALLGVRMFQLLARQRFDIIHAHLHEGALLGQVLGRLFHVPMVFDFQGSVTGEMLDHHFLRENSPFLPPLLRLERWLDQSAPVLLTSSTHARRLLLERFGCRQEQVRTLPDCVDAHTFVPASEHDAADLALLRAQLGIPAERKLIVYLGLLAEYQGISLLLEAMQRLVSRRQDVHLLLMGFPNVAQYQQRASDLGLANFVTLTGRVPYEKAPRYLALGDVAAAPKLSLTEGAGKLLNYMAVGLPVVAFDTPVAREYLGSDGIYAAAGDTLSLADSLESSLFSTRAASGRGNLSGHRLRQRAIQYFNWDTAARQIVESYGEVLHKYKTHAATPTDCSVAGNK